MAHLLVLEVHLNVVDVHPHLPIPTENELLHILARSSLVMALSAAALVHTTTSPCCAENVVTAARSQPHCGPMGMRGIENYMRLNVRMERCPRSAPRPSHRTIWAYFVRLTHSVVSCIVCLQPSCIPGLHCSSDSPPLLGPGGPMEGLHADDRFLHSG